MSHTIARFVLAGVLLASPVHAQQLPPSFDGPPAPAPPEVVSRDQAGRATVRAIRLASPLRVDGRLDEEVYSSTTAISDFIQTEPSEGAPASEKTEVWVL